MDAHKRAVQSLLNQVAQEVDSLPRPIMRAVAPALHAARIELEKELGEWLGNANPKQTFTVQEKRRALVAIRGALDRVAILEPAMKHALTVGGKRASHLATRHLQTELATFSKIFDKTIRPVPLVQAGIIAEGKRTLMTRYESSARRYAGAIGQDIRLQIATGLVKGETLGQLAKRLAGPGNARRVTEDAPQNAARYASERFFSKYEYWAERLVRTEVLNAYNLEASHGIAQVNKIDKRICRMWNAALDWRTCPLCSSLDHIVRSVDDLFPGGIDDPPCHPCCRCVVVAWRSDWEELGPRHEEI